MGLLNAIIEIINQSLAAKILTAVFFVLVVSLFLDLKLPISFYP